MYLQQQYNISFVLIIVTSIPSSLRRRAESPTTSENGESKKEDSELTERRALAQKLAAFKDTFVDKLHTEPIVTDLMNTMYSLIPVVEASGEKYSSVGRLAKIQDSLDRLHECQMDLEQTDQLMMPTLGSQVLHNN